MSYRSSSAVGPARAGLAIGIASISTLLGCLPGDTRPEPGSVHVTVRPSSASAEGFSTADGWQVSFERLLVGLGSTDLEGSDCTSYSEARYTRLFDFAVGFDDEKLGLVYGLGDCEVELGVRTPQRDALLGPGATAGDLDSMRIEVQDDWIEEPERAS